MVFDTYTAAEKFVKTNLNKALKEFDIKDWSPQFFIEDISDESSVKQDDEIRLFNYGTVMGINKSWLKNPASREYVCFELWYYTRIMYQVHEIVSSKSIAGSINDAETVEEWEKELDGIKEYRREEIEGKRATDIDAYAFAVFMMNKVYPGYRCIIPSEIQDEVKAKLNEIYGLV